MDDGALDAGRFSPWLREITVAIRGRGDADVPCGTCTACCTSAQFVHIAPDETDTLARIPAELLFPAPRAPRGHVLMGYDERGHCPMLVDGACSIYDDRPRTCRTYDCRVLAAADLDVESEAKSEIGDRARRWRFDAPTDRDRAEQGAVRAAARFLSENPDVIPPQHAPGTAAQMAALAIEVHGAFLADDGTGTPTVVTPDPVSVTRLLPTS